jgi:hypothetical protein
MPRSHYRSGIRGSATPTVLLNLRNRDKTCVDNKVLINDRVIPSLTT